MSTESFDKVKKWVSELRDHANNKEIIIIIAGNKSDIETQRRVDSKEALSFAKQYNAPHFLVSAKSGANINELFETMATKIYENKKKRGET